MQTQVQFPGRVITSGIPKPAADKDVLKIKPATKSKTRSTFIGPGWTFSRMHSKLTFRTALGIASHLSDLLTKREINLGLKKSRELEFSRVDDWTLWRSNFKNLQWKQKGISVRSSLTAEEQRARYVLSGRWNIRRRNEQHELRVRGISDRQKRSKNSEFTRWVSISKLSLVAALFISQERIERTSGETGVDVGKLSIRTIGHRDIHGERVMLTL